ncbi:Ig-like domain-containing protein, partial [Aliarcobacter butzleri]|uniref:Ig-like domain-containing protein n=1 Tax=Aliarcobacter butzleri TaxID=28197 RepID=UPI00214C6183
ITDKTLSNATKYETVVIDTTSVTTTILDNTTDKPNDPSTTEKDQENVILKIVAADENGNPIKDANGDYLTQNEVPEGDNAYYVVLAFEPNTTKFNDTTKLDVQSGTVEVQTFDKNATGITTTQTKEDGTQDYVSKTEKVELGKVISVKTLDDWKADNGEQYEIKITDKSYEHPQENGVVKPIYENVITDKDPVITTIKDNTTDKPNDPSKIEDTQESVILKIVAVDKDGNPIIKDGKYTFANEVAEGSNAKYMVIAFKPDTTEFKVTDKLDVQAGTVTIKTTDDTAKTTGTKDNAQFDYVSETAKVITVGEVFAIQTLDDYLKDDGEKYKVSINDKSYEHPQENGIVKPIYENVVTDKDPVTTTIKDNTTPGTEIVLVAVNSSTTTIADITNPDGTLKITNTNETPEGGKLYYIAVAIDKDGKPLATQGGDVKVSYTDNTTTKNTDYEEGKLSTKVGVVFEVKTKDDYYAEGDEKFTVKITDLKNSPYETSTIDTTKDTVTSTITDNAPVKNHQVDGTGGIDGTVYGKEDTVYAVITSSKTLVVEGGEVTYTVKLVDSTGKEVKVTSDTKVTVTFGTNNSVSDGEVELKGTPNNNPLENGENITITIPKNGNTASFTIKTKDDFTADNNETFNLKITDIDSKEFENLVYDNKNGIDTIIKDGVTLGDPVDTIVYEDGLNNLATTENSLSNSLGITNPNNDAYTVSFDKTIKTTTEKSNGQTITYSYNESGTVLTAKRTDGKTVFTVELKKDASGKDVYNFQLKEAMDHEYGNNGKNEFDLPFKFNVTSNGTTSENKTFNVTVVDSVPNATDKTVTTNEDTDITIRLSNEAFKDGTIKINGTDVVKDASIAIYEKGDTTKEIGTLINNGDGTVKFTPSPDYSNYDFTKSPQFTYTVTDFDGDEATATVTVNVKPVADAPTVNVKDVTTYEDASKYDDKDTGNKAEGQNKIPLGLIVPSLSKDQTDKNNATGDAPERNGEITLSFTNSTLVTGAELYNGNTKVADITANDQVVKIVIVKTSGGTDIDTDYHHNGTLPAKGGNVLYLTKAEYEGLKIQHAEDNDTDIAIKISVTSYEVDDSGKPLTGNLATSSTTTADMTVIIKPVTDDIELTFDNATVNGETLGTISPDGKTFTYKNIDEGNTTIDLKALLSNTSGGLNGTGGTKADLDGSEKRTYTISGIPEGTVVTLGGQTATANASGVATIEFNDTNNKNIDPDFSMKFPEHYSGTVDAKITLSVIDKGNGTEHTNNNGTEKIGADGQGEWGEVKTTEVNFKVNVYPVADEATMKVGQVVGYEDAGRNLDKNIQDKDGTIKHPENGIALDIKVTSTDTDGSETFTVTIKDIPNGGAIFVKEPITGKDILVTYAQDGTPTIKVWNNGTLEDYTETVIKADKGSITIEKYDNANPPKFIPPHNEHGDFKLNVEAKTVDTQIINGVEKTDTQTVATAKEITVIVKDVADSVVGNEYKTEELVLADSSKKSYNAITTEDTEIKLSSIFNNDGKGGFDYTKLASYDSSSEDLTIIIKEKDLPNGVTLEGENVNYINGQYIFKATDIDGITIKTPANYSGELNFDITYITTERGEVVDGKTIASKTFDSEKSTDKVSIFVKPTVDAGFISNTTKAEDSGAEKVENGNSYYKLDLGISHQNGDSDETLESVKLDKPVDGDFKLFIKNSDGSFTAITDFSKTYTAEEIKNIYVQAPENKHGNFTISGSFEVKDSHYGSKDVNYETTKTQNFTHKLTITPVTDKPELKIESINLTNSEVSGTKVLIKDSTASFTVNTKTTSVDTDGSEKVVKIVISGVPQGVTIDNISDKLGQDKEGVSLYEHNGVYVIEVNENITSLNGILENIKFDISSSANFIDRDITITTYTEDSGNGDIKQDTEIINIVKDYGTGGGTGQGIVLETKPYNGTVEDTKFSLLNIFNVSAGQQTGDITIKVEHGTIEGYTPDANGVYTIHLKGNAADIGTILSQIKVIPDLNFNDNKGEMQLTVSGFGLVDKIVDVAVTPVTDEAKLTITPIDSGTEISENGEFKFDIKLTNNVDVGTTLKDNVIYIKAVENYKDTAESATGKIYYIDANGDKQPLSADGKFELKDGYTIDNLPKFVYEAGENRNGNVTINVTSENKELNAGNYKEASGSTTITVKPTVSSEIKIEKVQDGIEDGQMAGVKLNLTKADPSEKFESVLVKVVPGVAVYYDNGSKLAMNLGDGSWLVPINSNGTLPEIFFKGSEDLAGNINFTATINVKDGEDKVTKILDGNVYIKEVADGVTIDPTKTGIDAKGFEWTSLNLNANMKDVDGSEKMHFTIEKLDSSAQFRVKNSDGTYTDLSSKASQDASGKWTINGVEYKDINNIEISHDKSVKDVEVKAWTVDGDDVSTSDPVTGTFDLSYKADAKFDNGVFTLAKDMDIDFNNIGKLGFTNVEKIDLGSGNGENELLNLTLDDVLAIGKKDVNGNINLDILGGADDKVTFKDSIGEDGKENKWSSKDITDNNGNKLYTEWSNTGDESLKVKVEQPVSDGITN